MYSISKHWSNGQTGKQAIFELDLHSYVYHHHTMYVLLYITLMIIFYQDGIHLLPLE